MKKYVIEVYADSEVPVAVIAMVTAATLNQVMVVHQMSVERFDEADSNEMPELPKDAKVN